MISIPEDFLAEIDKVVKEEKSNRSEWLREAAKHYIRFRNHPIPPMLDPVVQKAIAIQDSIAKKDKSKDWDSTAEIRKWRDRK
jgi:hypothetical protein